MPRYFFDIHDDTLHRDELGLDLPCIEAAQIAAQRVVAEMAVDRTVQDAIDISVSVRDEVGSQVLCTSLSITSAITPLGRSAETQQLSRLAS